MTASQVHQNLLRYNACCFAFNIFILFVLLRSWKGETNYYSTQSNSIIFIEAIADLCSSHGGALTECLAAILRQLKVTWRLSVFCTLLFDGFYKPISTWVSKTEVMHNRYVIFCVEDVTKWVDDGSPVSLIK